MKCFIYDYETLGTTVENAAMISIGYQHFDTKKFLEGDGYDYHKLVESAGFMKFDIKDQVTRLGRKVEAKTVKWWGEQSQEARDSIAPKSDDVPLENLYEEFKTQAMTKPDWVFTRGNTFDPMFTYFSFKAMGKEDPFYFWTIRDVRSYIDGLLVGNEHIGNSFVVPGLKEVFVAHDPRHDVAMDIMRMQSLHRELLL